MKANNETHNKVDTLSRLLTAVRYGQQSSIRQYLNAHTCNWKPMLHETACSRRLNLPSQIALPSKHLYSQNTMALKSPANHIRCMANKDS